MPFAPRDHVWFSKTQSRGHCRHTVSRGGSLWSVTGRRVVLVICLVMACIGDSDGRLRAGGRSKPLGTDTDSRSWVRPRSREPGTGIYWRKCHSKYLKEIKEKDAESGYDVVFFGDSITESWRGTYMGSSWSLFTHIPIVWKKLFGKYRAAAFGISGDKVGNLMWRLMHGELPKKAPKVMVFLIGTNDVSGLACTLPVANTTTEQLQYLITYVHAQHPTSQLLLLGLLPKGDDWPNMCSPALLHVNAGLQEIAKQSSQVSLQSRP